MQNRIQILRKEHKLTQNDLAQELEVTRQTIISLESGRYNASLLLAHKIARFFDLTIEDVFIFDEGEEEL
ncbi:helix-turn-helix transcriptional regulator [Enterococcus pingfangensis]|uniref:helix-turn-helix transcriptional regulator n=1 Tax=Enterococcus pingfangensis TaxID=2559924 RepID=UPI0010F8FE19|nr:helix-turn-helix transcriptional regulator [Enterococcus pingfangensis]